MEGTWRRVLVPFILLAVLALAALEVAASRLGGSSTIVGTVSRATDADSPWADAAVSEVHLTEVPARTGAWTR